MRVITGTARGCKLETLNGLTTRPTAERVKEGLFSAIQFDISGRRVLDGFAGSGQLGIEALSRGAASCMFIDQNRDACEVIKRNLRAAHLAEHAQVLGVPLLRFLSTAKDQFDLVFLDPPYAENLLPACLDAVVPHVSSGGLIVCESEEGQTLPQTVGAFSQYRTHRYGRVYITIYRQEANL